MPLGVLPSKRPSTLPGAAACIAWACCEARQAAASAAWQPAQAAAPTYCGGGGGVAGAAAGGERPQDASSSAASAAALARRMPRASVGAMQWTIRKTRCMVPPAPGGHKARAGTPDAVSAGGSQPRRDRDMGGLQRPGPWIKLAPTNTTLSRAEGSGIACWPRACQRESRPHQTARAHPPGAHHDPARHQRQDPLLRRRSLDAAAVVPARRRQPHRHQVRLRHGPVRRLHRAPRRPGGPLLRHAGGRGGGQEDHHGGSRGPRQGRPRRAGGVAEAGRGAVRLLPVRPDHVGHGAAALQQEAQRRRHRRRDERQRLPLRHLRAHPRRDPRSRRFAGGLRRTDMNDISRGILIVNESRRRFLQGAGGLALGIYTGAAFADSGTAAPGSAGGGLVGAGNFEPNAFVRIGTDNSVTVVAKHLEMGQGTFTGLATLVAGELDADWELVRVEGAPADNNKYKNLLMGIQLTGGSTAMANSWEQMRKAGAAARAMLVAAAAQEWKVAPASISVAKGWVHSKNGHKTSFGQLALKAAQQPVPQDVALKDPKDFQLIGKQKLHRKDHADKTNGSAVFTQDYKLPDMLVAVVAHPQRFGAVPRTVNADKARAVPNVVEVVQFGGDNKTRFSGVAVLAKNTWAARSGRDALEIDWDESGAFRLGSEQIMAQYREMAGKDGLVARKEGDAAAAFAAKPAKLIEAEYELPTWRTRRWS